MEYLDFISTIIVFEMQCKFCCHGLQGAKWTDSPELRFVYLAVCKRQEDFTGSSSVFGSIR